jgi:hypothetical protein
MRELHRPPQAGGSRVAALTLMPSIRPLDGIGVGAFGGARLESRSGAWDSGTSKRNKTLLWGSGGAWAGMRSALPLLQLCLHPLSPAGESGWAAFRGARACTHGPVFGLRVPLRSFVPPCWKALLSTIQATLPRGDPARQCPPDSN